MDNDANYYLNILVLMGLMAGIPMVYFSSKYISKIDNFDHKRWDSYKKESRGKSDVELKIIKLGYETDSNNWKLRNYKKIRNNEFERGVGWGFIILSIAIEIFKGGLKL
jgi:hypothetical protein